MKLLEENRTKSSVYWNGQEYFYKTLETQETNGERRKRQMPQAKKFLHNPENNQQNEKTNYRVSDNIGTVIYI